MELVAADRLRKEKVVQGLPPPCSGGSVASTKDTPFHRLLDILPAAAYTCDAEGLITYFNRHALALWGREPKLNDPVDRY
jgi:hypothetical protein